MSHHAFALALASVEPAARLGMVRRVLPGHVEASGPFATLGDVCEIERDGASSVLAEVAAVEDSHVVLIPFDATAAIFPDARVRARPARSMAQVGEGFAGRAIDALGEPLDGGPRPLASDTAPLEGRVLAPMQRLEPRTMLETGIRALDGLLTLGRGQRVGVFSASGVGKTTLVKQLAAQTACDRCVLCLVGERGREVEAMWRELSSRNHRKLYTCVAATSDLSAPLRARAVHQALSLSEHWRAEGQHVLLIVDSVTRYAMALREIGLAAGAPPTLRAYTPNVFAALPRLVERCGASKSGGSITALMTVLAETDDVDDPIVEVMKALLDGHIVLSRQLAEQGHFPAIDVLRSVSRQSEALMQQDHAADVRRATALLAAYEDARVMIESGIYKAGANAALEEAMRARPALLEFLRQKPSERTAPADTTAWLKAALAKSQSHA